MKQAEHLLKRQILTSMSKKSEGPVLRQMAGGFSSQFQFQWDPLTVLNLTSVTSSGNAIKQESLTRRKNQESHYGATEPNCQLFPVHILSANTLKRQSGQNAGTPSQ